MSESCTGYAAVKSSQPIRSRMGARHPEGEDAATGSAAAEPPGNSSLTNSRAVGPDDQAVSLTGLCETSANGSAAMRAPQRGGSSAKCAAYRTDDRRPLLQLRLNLGEGLSPQRLTPRVLGADHGRLDGAGLRGTWSDLSRAAAAADLGALEEPYVTLDRPDDVEQGDLVNVFRKAKTTVGARNGGKQLCLDQELQLLVQVGG